MMAAGLLMLGAGWLIHLAFGEGGGNTNEVADLLAEWLAFIGFVALLLGGATWLWVVAP